MPVTSRPFTALPSQASVHVEDAWGAVAYQLYSYKDIRVLHLEPSTRCQAGCPMCGRNIDGGRTRENLPLTDITLGRFRDWFRPEFLRQLKTISFCGNFGDPIFAQDLVPILAHARSANPRIFLTLNTNGSARKAEFWRDLGHFGAVVHFALDGATAESHQRYRRHTRFEQILENARCFVAAGGRAVWDMLVFDHNEGEVGAAERLSREIGFEKFVLKSTNRFFRPEQQVLNERGEQVDTLRPSGSHPPALDARNRPRSDTLRSCAIDCKVMKDRSVYVAADGTVFPCCWLGSSFIDRPGLPDSRFGQPGHEYLERFEALVSMLGAENLNLAKNPLPVIVNRYFPHFARGWLPGDMRLEKCAQICGTTGLDPFTSTFVAEKDWRVSA